MSGRIRSGRAARSRRESEGHPGWLRELAESLLIGLTGGGACLLFYACSQWCDQTRISHEWLLCLLPAAGLLVVFLYDGILGEKDLSMGAIYRCIQEGKPVSGWLAPMIFLSTCLAYLTGGSVGRAGSALQIGGGIGAGLGSRWDRYAGRKENAGSGEIGGSAGQFGASGKPDPIQDRALSNASPINDCHCLSDSAGSADNVTLRIICGLSAGFTAILHAPLAGAVFGLEVLVFSRKSRTFLLPALLSSYITWGMAEICGRLFGLSYTDFSLPASCFASLMGAGQGAGRNAAQGAVQDAHKARAQGAAQGAAHGAGVCLSIWGRLLLLLLAAALVARLYCYCRRLTAWAMARLLRNVYLRVLAGTLLVILITRLLGTMDCNGVGFSYAAGALHGDCFGPAFACKLLLTVLTLGCGIRGGEIAPNIFIGAAFGCAAAPLLGLDPCLGAAVCLVCVLAGVTNCSLAIFLYGCEAICCSPAAVLAFLAAALIAHVFSGEISIYREQAADRLPGKLRLPVSFRGQDG